MLNNYNNYKKLKVKNKQKQLSCYKYFLQKYITGVGLNFKLNFYAWYYFSQFTI